MIYFGVAIIVAYIAAVSYVISAMIQLKEPHLIAVFGAIMIGLFWPITVSVTLLTGIAYLFYLVVLFTTKKSVKL